jgi:hypothetical protein
MADQAGFKQTKACYQRFAGLYGAGDPGLIFCGSDFLATVIF